MVLATQKLATNFHLQELKIGKCSPFTYLPKQPVSDKLTIQEGVDLNDLEKLCVLGHGNYGIVYKVCHRPTSAIYALKIIQEDMMSVNPCSVSHETEILTCTNSPFIVKCHDIFKLKLGEKAILMEYMDSGTLDSIVRVNGPLSETLIANIAIQVLNGLNYLHSQNIVHLDIKPSNLLVGKDMKVKISDFGVSKIIHDIPQAIRDNFSNQGTFAYMSPERLDSETFGSDYLYAGDVWSLGITLWELYLGNFPLISPQKKPSFVEIVMVVCYGEFPALPEQASPEFVSFLKCCLERYPSKRWTASQLLSHPFVYKEK